LNDTSILKSSFKIRINLKFNFIDK